MDWRAPLLAAAAVVLVFHGNLGYFFGQDDYLGLARARGLAPPLSFPWRWVSGPGYFALMRPFGIASAVPYHAVSLLAHAGAAWLLTTVLLRRFSAPASLVGALLFAVHPAIYTAIYSTSGIGEILCGLFAVGTIALAARGRRARWWALPCFALALLSKETVLLLPLVLLIEPAWLMPSTDAPGEASVTSDRRSRRHLVLALCALAAGYAALLFAQDTFAVRSGLSSHAAYALGFGSHIIGNFASYLGWTVNMLVPTTHSFEDAIDSGAYAAAIPAAALWLLGGLSRPLRERGWLAGGAYFVLLLVPVLGLRNHTYHYYLYAPLIGAAWCAAALFDAVAERVAPSGSRTGRGRSRPARIRRGGENAPRGSARPAVGRWVVALALGAGLTMNGGALVRKIELFPFTDPRLRADPIVDRARIARNVYDGLRSANLSPGTPLVFWSPASLRYERRNHPGLDVTLSETPWERNVRAALLDGLAVRVLLPELGGVTFIHSYAPVRSDARFVLYDPDGHLRVTTPGELDSLLAIHQVL